MPDYSLGKIYKVVNSVNSKIYIGSTCWPLSKRMGGHRAFGKALRKKTPIYLAMYEIGTEHFQILLVQNAPCKSKEELLAIEYQVAQRYQQRGVVLYNATIDGSCSEETRAKMSRSQCKRGCVRYDKHKNQWRFSWRNNGQQKSKYFAVKRYGTAARGLALYWQEEMYPIEREDDSELIREIRARIEA